MGVFVRGQVVVLSFPFSDLKAKQLRPVLVLANPGKYNDLIVCMITAKRSDSSIEITDADFLEGQLTSPISYVRPDRLFTAEPTLVKRIAGTLTSSKMREILDQLSLIFGMDHDES